MDENVTPEDRAMHYARWHVEAYGCAAPLEEVIAQVMIRHGMNPKDATAMLMGMDANRKIEIKDKSGDPCVVPVESD